MLSNGVIKVKPKYYLIGAFENGKAEVRNTEDSKSYYINEKLEEYNIWLQQFTHTCTMMI